MTLIRPGGGGRGSLGGGGGGSACVVEGTATVSCEGLDKDGGSSADVAGDDGDAIEDNDTAAEEEGSNEGDGDVDGDGGDGDGEDHNCVLLRVMSSLFRGAGEGGKGERMPDESKRAISTSNAMLSGYLAVRMTSSLSGYRRDV